jgi:hypothetical protein
MLRVARSGNPHSAALLLALERIRSAPLHGFSSFVVRHFLVELAAYRPKKGVIVAGEVAEAITCIVEKACHSIALVFREDAIRHRSIPAISQETGVAVGLSSVAIPHART